MEIGKASCQQKLFSEREILNYRVCGKEKKNERGGRDIPKTDLGTGDLNVLSEHGHRTQEGRERCHQQI